MQYLMYEIFYCLLRNKIWKVNIIGISLRFQWRGIYQEFHTEVQHDPLQAKEIFVLELFQTTNFCKYRPFYLTGASWGNSLVRLRFDYFKWWNVPTDVIWQTLKRNSKSSLQAAQCVHFWLFMAKFAIFNVFGHLAMAWLFSTFPKLERNFIEK